MKSFAKVGENFNIAQRTPKQLKVELVNCLILIEDLLILDRLVKKNNKGFCWRPEVVVLDSIHSMFMQSVCCLYCTHFLLHIFRKGYISFMKMNFLTRSKNYDSMIPYL